MKKIKAVVILLLFLLLSVLPTTSQDIILTEYHTEHNDVLSIRRISPSNYDSYAQVFEMGITGPTEDYYITSVQIYCYKEDFPNGNLYVDIRNTSANKPVSGDSNYIAQTSKLASSISGDLHWEEFIFPTPVRLNYGTKYALAVWTDGTASLYNWIGWMAGGSGHALYDGAVDNVWDGTGVHTSWTVVTTYDATFKFYGYNATSPLAFGTPAPENDEDNQHLDFDWQIGIIDVNGDPFNWTIECNNSQQSSANLEANGTKILSLSGLAFNTTYTVYVNATDGFYWTNETYTFKTRVAEYSPFPPTVGDEYPSNSTNYVLINTNMNVMVFDPNNDTMNTSFYWINDSVIHEIHNTENGTVSEFVIIDYFLMSHDTEYTWYVNVTDGIFNVTSDIFTFHTCRAWDLDGDGETNYLDVSSLVSNYDVAVSPPGYEPWDINNDGDTNYLDVSSLVSHYGESY